MSMAMAASAAATTTAPVPAVTLPACLVWAASSNVITHAHSNIIDAATPRIPASCTRLRPIGAASRGDHVEKLRPRSHGRVVERRDEGRRRRLPDLPTARRPGRTGPADLHRLDPAGGRAGLARRRARDAPARGPL